MALIVFVYTFYLGIKTHGAGYIKHFTGDIWWMAPLMLPIHIVGEISRPISLTLRLFGNIMGEDTVILVLTVALFPLLVPVPMLLMAIFTSLLQALVFTILTGVYLSGALSEGH
jgi:F-type H+-transporting ATPase subunit a